MSWSIQVIGTPEKVAQALDEHTGKLTGQSLMEFSEAKPHLQALIRQNVGPEMLVEVAASGHADFQDGARIYGTCQVNISMRFGKIAV